MKNIVRVISVILVSAICVFTCGCKKDKSMSDYNLEKYITLPEYKGITIDTESVDYTFGIAYAHYENYTDSSEKTETEELSEGTVQVLDTVNIDYVGKKDGVAFEGGTAEGYDLMIGSDSFIDGFESGLLGKKIGDTVELELTFPKNYQTEELAGASVVFTVTINSISRPNIPEINESFAKDMGYETVEDYKSYLEDTYIDDYVWKYVVSGSKAIMYPEEQLEKYVDDNIEQFVSQAEASGTTLETALSQYGFTEETYREYLVDYAKSYVLQEMVFYRIAEIEDITVENSEVDDFLAENYSESNISDSDKELIYKSLLQRKVVVFLAENAKMV